MLHPKKGCSTPNKAATLSERGCSLAQMPWLAGNGSDGLPEIVARSDFRVLEAKHKLLNAPSLGRPIQLVACTRSSRSIPWCRSAKARNVGYATRWMWLGENLAAPPSIPLPVARWI